MFDVSHVHSIGKGVKTQRDSADAMEDRRSNPPCSRFK
jgi:hypothetical protein